MFLFSIYFIIFDTLLAGHDGKYGYGIIVVE